jgi:phage-related protein
MQWEIEFYENKENDCPVKNFIKGFTEKEQAKIIWQIDLLKKFVIKLCNPYTEKIHGKEYKGLWELRIKYSGNDYRIFYFLYIRNKFILLHGIIKKSNKTPKEDLQTALYRMKNYIEKMR